MQGKPADAGGRDDPARHGQAEELRLAIDVTPGRPALSAHDARSGIDADAAHRREVDDDPTVVDGVAGDVVPAATHRQERPCLRAKLTPPRRRPYRSSAR